MLQRDKFMDDGNRIHADLQVYLLAKITELSHIAARQAVAHEVHQIVKEEVKKYLSQFMLVIAQPND
jgi:hypothetical protein